MGVAPASDQRERAAFFIEVFARVVRLGEPDAQKVR